MTDQIKLHKIKTIEPYYQVRPITDLKDMIQQSAELFGERTAFRFRHTPQSQVISKTYREALDDINAFGSALIKIVPDRPKIAIIGENRYEWIIAFLAVVNGAGIAVPIDRMLPPSELRRVLERGEVDAVIYSEQFHETVMAFARGNDRIKACICMNPGDGISAGDQGRYYSFHELVQKGYELTGKGDTSYTGIKPDNKTMCVLLFTSGTSADSKAVMLSHENLCADIMGIGGVVHIEPGESVLSILPLHHTFENTAGLLYPLYCGMTVAISDGLKYLSRNMTEHRPDVLVGVPLIFDKFRKKVVQEISKQKKTFMFGLLKGVSGALRFAGLDMRRIMFKKLLEPFGGNLRAIITGGAAMEPDLARWYDSIGIHVHQGYGLTETSPVVAGCNDRVRKPGTCGEPLPGVSVAIANPDLKGIGEIVVKGKTVMLGYWNDPEATRNCMTDGWFHTGDLGRIDRRGLLHVTGRLKSMIVLKNGKKVFPEELEFLLNKQPCVKESFVWGETLDGGEVEVCAKIVLDPENMPCDLYDNQAIRNILDQAIREINKQVPAYKAIRYYVYGYKELVKTTTLKIKRYVETNRIHKALESLAISIKNVCGKNFDALEAAE